MYEDKINCCKNLLFLIAKFLCILIVFISNSSSSVSPMRIDDIFIPENCDSIAEQMDHLLIYYSFIFANNTIGLSLESPNQLFHIQLSNMDEMPVLKYLKGMCENSTRDIIWDSSFGVNFSPLIRSESIYSLNEEPLTIRIFLNFITKQKDFHIFDALRSNDITVALDVIESNHGVNAVDEWGHSSIMIAVINQNMPVIAALMNARRPMLNVNMMKPVSYYILS